MATASQAVAARPTLWSRVYGFGSIFAKTVRDSRRATIIAAGVLALIFIGVSRAITAEFATQEARTELEHLAVGLRGDEGEEEAPGRGHDLARALRRRQALGPLGCVLALEALEDGAHPLVGQPGRGRRVGAVHEVGHGPGQRLPGA